MIDRISIIGPQSCGKTSYVMRLMRREAASAQPTFTPQIYQFCISGRNAQIIDLSGRQELLLVAYDYIRQSEYVILAFDCSDQRSFKEIDAIFELLNLRSKNTILLKLKTDLEEEVRSVDEDAFIKEHNISSFIESNRAAQNDKETLEECVAFSEELVGDEIEEKQPEKGKTCC